MVILAIHIGEPFLEMTCCSGSYGLMFFPSGMQRTTFFAHLTQHRQQHRKGTHQSAHGCGPNVIGQRTSNDPKSDIFIFVGFGWMNM
jgi:hypothetical protein